MNYGSEDESKEISQKRKIMGAAGLYGRKAWEGIKGTGRGIRDVGSFYMDQQKQKLKRDLKSGRPIRTLAKGYAGIGLATIGLAAGIAEGNAGHALQHAGQGFLLGSKVGGNVYDSTHVDGLGDVYERSTLGEEEYKKRQAYKNQMEVAERESTIRTIQQKMNVSRTKAKELAKEYAVAYMNEGIDNVSDWVKIEKMTTSKTLKVKHKDGTIGQYSRNEAIAAHKLYTRYDISKKIGQGKEEDVINQIAEDYTNGNKAQAQIFFKAAKDYDNIRNG